MGVLTSEVGYPPVMPRREDHEVHKDMWWHWGGDYSKSVIYMSILRGDVEISSSFYVLPVTWL